MEPMAEDTSSLEQKVGHPQDKWNAIQQRIQDDAIKSFSEVESDWLDLMWCLDAYRLAGIAPLNVGDASKSEAKRLEAFYKGKGNWFASMLALILENQTTQKLAPRSNVLGFSQTHQIDVAWPDRNEDPLICLETKVTGAGPSSDGGPRGAMADWTNRRKELKFAATDLKLYRRQHETSINHWDVWRQKQPPKTYLLWAARMAPKDKIDRMVAEVQLLVSTYLDGAGLVAWREVDGGYVSVSLQHKDRVSTVDDMLYRIASEIKEIAPPGREPPPPVKPTVKVMDELPVEEPED
jgi:hypothetical protein